MNLCLDKNDVMWVNQDRYGLCLYDLSQDLFADNSDNNLSNPGEVSIIVKSKLKEGVWISPRYGARVMRMTHQDMKIQLEEDIDLENKSIIREISGTWLKIIEAIYGFLPSRGFM